MTRHLILTLSLALTTPYAALAQEAATDHSGHSMAATDNPATQGFAEANARMHTDMAIEFTGNADVDFMRAMIPHHQGAIDMARIVLEHGTDPDVRELAEEVIEAQTEEIAFMQEWLAEYSPGSTPNEEQDVIIQDSEDTIEE